MPDLRNDTDFANWNEEMVRRYDIDRYYEKSHPVVRWTERRRLSALRELARPRAGERVLEVGVGGGHVLERFAECERVGVDLSNTMLERARRRLGAAVTLLPGSAEKLPFDDASFDIVLCTEVLEHTQHPEQVIGELMRVARVGGRVLVSIPNERDIDALKRMIRRIPIVRSMLRSLAAEGNEWHLHRFDRPLLEAVSRRSAEIAQIRAIPGALLPIRYVALLRHRTDGTT